MDGHLHCVGFDHDKWRLMGFVNHLVAWLPDYALDNESLKEFNHANSWEKTREAAIRIYSTEYPETRGEIGEISLHALCRTVFDTVPLVPRLFYITSSNEVVKGFDLVHYRVTPPGTPVEIWLGEAKFYGKGLDAIADAIASVRKHLDEGFLKRDKLFIGPQIPRSIPRYEEIRALFKDATPIDQLKARAVFPIGILADSAAVKNNSSHCDDYLSSVATEFDALAGKLQASGLFESVSVVLFYVPLLAKSEIILRFDKKLKAIQDD